MNGNHFKNSLEEYLMNTNDRHIENNSSSQGGYYIPEFIVVPRRGVLGYFCRLFNIKYGWTKFNMYKSLLSKKQITLKRKIKL